MGACGRSRACSSLPAMPPRPAQRPLVRDGGFWSPQLELELDVVGYHSLISLPLGHSAAEQALQTSPLR